MKRRSFLGALVATAAGLFIPERLADAEPKRVYSFIRLPRRAPMLQVYTGTMPRHADAALTEQAILCAIPLSVTELASGAFAARGLEASARATGVAGFVRLTDAYGKSVFDMDADALLTYRQQRAIVTGDSVRVNLELPAVLARHVAW